MMDTLNPEVAQFSDNWLTYLWPVLFLAGLFLLQKYLHLFDQKLISHTRQKRFESKKPWPLYAFMSLGLLVFLYNLFSPHDIQLNLHDWITFKWVVLILAIAVIFGVALESLTLFGPGAGFLRLGVYLILMAVYFYAGFVFGLILAVLLALLVLVYFIRYFKNLLSVK